LSNFQKARERMVESQLIGRGIHDPVVLAAMRQVPRHRFVDEALQGQAYSDYPLPISDRQTISQPYIVALMSEALAVKKEDKVLEIGTGSGYQTAVLAELAERVFTIERIPSLSHKARQLLQQLGYRNVVFKIGDGTLGWVEEAPFDAILVSAGAPRVPQPLVDQMAMGARLIVPVGDHLSQELILVERVAEGIRKSSMGGCRFVDLIGKSGWQED
jgi:protein-L-isoaspartate(D-aspartate) O-methyltransferase